ncbi:hypothetical protein [Clostridium sp. E02]|uniref:hypothetical protein n=1 Tax=Clostridium sp. E02 TaxID=2487134 RepID=UPI000F540B69|nr:hypothetical protein [Clostridium sp. E02]
MAQYIPVYGIVSSITAFNESPANQSCTVLISINTPKLEQINFLVTPQTYVVNQHTFKTGNAIVALYDSTIPVPLIYPPQYTAVVLAEHNIGTLVELDYFNEYLQNTSQTLQLEIPEDGNTLILLSNGQISFEAPENHYLFVIYPSGNDVVPVVTIPIKVIVFCTP